MQNRSIINPLGCVTRSHRTAFVLLLDLSSSMQELVEYKGIMTPKSEVMNNIANHILREFCLRSYRNGELYNYFDIAIIGYSGEKVVTLLDCKKSDENFISITDLYERYYSEEATNRQSAKLNTPADIKDLFDRSTFDLSISGATPMYEALSYAYTILKRWCSRYEHFDSVAPAIYHITDGYPTDCDLGSIIDVANRLKSLKSNCSEVTLMNIKFDSEVLSEHERALLFPTDEEIEGCSDPFVRTLARSSSIMTESCNPMIEELRDSCAAGGYRGYGSGISVAEIISMINIGTMSTTTK